MTHPHDDLQAAPPRTLQGALPSLSVAQACSCRVGFDVRFERWLREALARPELRVERAAVVAKPLIHVELRSAHGRLALALEAHAWPALRLAAGLTDAGLREAVIATLLAPVAAALASVLGDVTFAPLRLIERDGEANLGGGLGDHPVFATLHAAEGRASLLGCDETVLQRFRAAWRHTLPVEIRPLGQLALRARVVVMTRWWPRGVLDSLRAGDLVLPPEPSPAGGARPLARALVGCGVHLRAHLQLDVKENRLEVTDSPQLSAEEPLPVDAGVPPASLDELQLPISFELDTARISLAELACMQPGYAIELDLPLLDTVVRLVCHGQTVGQGQLVAIGERIGVRITRMGFVDEPPGLH